LNERGCDFGQAICPFLGPLILDSDVVIFDPTKLAQTLHKYSNP
jgi:hypothetical protein